MAVIDRARAKRLSRDLAAGAAFGVLLFVAVHALGLQAITRWDAFELLPVFVIAAAVLYATAARPLLWGAAVVLVALLLVVIYTPAVVRPAQSLIRADPLAQSVDAVVVLASGVNDDALLDSEALDRLLAGLALARDGRMAADGAALPLVVTLVRQRTAPHRTSAEDQQRIIDLAGPEVTVHWTDRVESTRDEARLVAVIARAEGWDRLAVVTSPLHTRRACATFENARLAVTCVPAGSRQLAVGTLRRPGDRLRAFRLAYYEVVGTMYYKLRGWI